MEGNRLRVGILNKALRQMMKDKGSINTGALQRVSQGIASDQK